MASKVEILLHAKDEASPGIGKVTNALGGLGSLAAGAVAVGLAAAAAAMAGIVVGMGALAVAAVKGNAEFERYETQFGVLLGSVDAAKQRLADLAEFGAKTPFELPEVVRADKILQSFGLHAEDAAERFGFSGTQIRTIAGDVAAGTGASFEEISRYLGMFSTGATGMAISRMQELGIVTRAQLADMGLEFSKAGELMTPVDDAMDVLLAAMQDKFGGMMDAQSATLEGMLSNFEDWKGATIRKLGEPIFDAVKEQLGSLMTFLNSPQVMGALDGIAQRIGDTLARVIPVLQSIVMAFGEFFSGLATGEDVIGDVANLFYNIANALGLDGAGVFGAVIQLREPFEALVGFIGANIPAVQALIGTAFAAIQTIFASLSGFVTGTLMPAIAKIWGETNAELPTAQQTFEGVFAAINAAIGIAVGFITGVLVPALTAAVDWVVDNWPEIQATAEQVFANVQAAIVAVVGFVQTVLIPAFNTAVAWFETNWPAIQATVTSVFATVQSTIQTVMPVVLGIITSVLGAIQTFWDAHGASIVTIVTGYFNNFMTVVSNIMTSTRIVIETVLNVISVFWDAWGATIMTAVDTMAVGIGAIFDAFAAAFRGDWEAFGDALRVLADAIWANMVLLAKTALDNILAVDWYGLGQSIIQGIARGISNTVGMLADAARNAARAAYEAALAFIEPGSPSKLFARIGVMIGAGLAEGIRASTDLVTEAVQDMLGAATVFSGLGGAAASIFRERTVDPLKDTINSLESVIDDMGESLDEMGESLADEMGTEELETLMRLLRLPPNAIDPDVARFQFTPEQIANAQRLIDLQDQMAARREELADRTEELAEAEAHLLELQKQQQDLQFLQQQVRLLDLIAEHGLDAGEILGGLELGINASLTGVIDAMTAALRQIVADTQTELGIHSPSTVFTAIGRNLMQSLGLGITGSARVPAMAMAGAVTNIYNTVNAQYAYQDSGTVSKELALMSRLNR
jgi:phage-related protein